MEIIYLLFFALSGVGAIGILLYTTGTHKDAVIKDKLQVQHLIDNELSDFQASEILLSADFKTSIAIDKSGSSIASIYCLGDSLVVREYYGDDIVGSHLSGGTGKVPLTLQIHVSDFAHPKFDIVLQASSSQIEPADTQKAQDVGNYWNKKLAELIERGVKIQAPAKLTD